MTKREDGNRTFERLSQVSSRLCEAKWLVVNAMAEKTALAGQIQKEVNCLPVENTEYRQIMDRRAQQSMKPKRETKLLTGVVSSHGGNLLAPGTLGSSGNFDRFIVSPPLVLNLADFDSLRNPPGRHVENLKSPRPLGCRRMSYWT